ncbi:MAG TPA: imidazole glycerol phosphate synthase subunit HisH [Flavobacteriales bacterium]|jgi:glutamine amidotransferase
MKVAIVKYNAGNTHSVELALQRLGVDSILTDDAETLRSADKVIFPGVGEASSAMQYLKEHGLDKVITTLKQPTLGICLGMQLMCAHSEEGNADTLGIFNNHVKMFPKGIDKVPHMGWNSLTLLKSALYQGIEENAYAYFVHSFYVEISNTTTAQCNYANTLFSASLEKDNFYGVQFHPEKSSAIGEQLLKNFLAL